MAGDGDAAAQGRDGGPPPAELAALELAAEIGVEHQVRQLRVAVEGFFDLAQEGAADDAARRATSGPRPRG